MGGWVGGWVGGCGCYITLSLVFNLHKLCVFQALQKLSNSEVTPKALRDMSDSVLLLITTTIEHMEEVHVYRGMSMPVCYTTCHICEHIHVHSQVAQSYSFGVVLLLFCQFSMPLYPVCLTQLLYKAKVIFVP